MITLIKCKRDSGQNIMTNYSIANCDECKQILVDLKKKHF